jgi:hypothetical protein
MPDTYEVHTIQDARIWDNFVRTAHGGTIFSTYAWLECAAKATDQSFKCYGVYKNGSLLAGVSGMEARYGYLTRLMTPPLTPYGGLLFAPIPAKGPAKLEAEWGHATELIIAHVLTHYNRVQLSLAPSVHDVRKFTWSDWHAQILYTYEIDLTDLSALWERFERRTRTVLRKAENANFVLQPVNDLTVFRRQFELIYAKQGIEPPVDPSLVRSFADHAVAAGLARTVAIVSPEGDIASVVVFVDGFDRLYAWVAGADAKFNQSGATSLLYWQMFQESKLKRFDFVGANIPAIAKFKRGFGGDLVPYYVVDGFKNAAVKAAVTCKSAFRQWRSSLVKLRGLRT